MAGALLALVAAVSTTAAQEARCSAHRVGASGFAVEPLGGSAYCVTNGSAMTLFWVTGRGVVLLDAAPALAGIVAPAVASVTAAPVTHVIYSHAHRDHIGAAGNLPAVHTRIAHPETNRFLLRSADPLRPAANRITRTARDTLRVGGTDLVLAYVGPAHLPGTLLVHDPRARVLAGVDLYNGANAPYFRLGMATDIPGYVAAHDSLLTFDFDTFVGGHGVRAGMRADLERQREYVRTVIANADAALAAVNVDDAVRSLPAQAHPFERTAVFFAAQARHCERATIAAWQGRLPGVEHVTYSICDAVLESRRVD